MVLTNLMFNHGDSLMLIAVVLYAAYTLGLRNNPGLGSLTLFVTLSIAAFISSIPMTILEIFNDQAHWPTLRASIIILMIVIYPSLISQISFIKSVGLMAPEGQESSSTWFPSFPRFLRSTISVKLLKAITAWPCYLSLQGSFCLKGLKLSEELDFKDCHKIHFSDQSGKALFFARFLGVSKSCSFLE